MPSENAPHQTTIQPTPGDLAMAGLVQGDAADGDMIVGDGETECSDCERMIPEGEPVYWTSSQHDPDMVCGPCAIEWATSNHAICDALASGEITP